MVPKGMVLCVCTFLPISMDYCASFVYPCIHTDFRNAFCRAFNSSHRPRQGQSNRVQKSMVSSSNLPSRKKKRRETFEYRWIHVTVHIIHDSKKSSNQPRRARCTFAPSYHNSKNPQPMALLRRYAGGLDGPAFRCTDMTGSWVVYA